MKTLIKVLLITILMSFCACNDNSDIEKYGKHYQLHGDYQSLEKVVELMDSAVDTTYVKKILGEPIDMGFDYRYLVDSTGAEGCPIGAVFHINEEGRIDQQWIGEICE